MDRANSAKKTKETGARVQRLLDRLGMSQEAVAFAAVEAGKKLSRNDVNKVCTGLNGATTERVRAGLAAGMKLPRLALNEYLDGTLGLDDLLRRQLRLVDPPEDKSDELKFGQLRGWDVAEREARATSATADNGLTEIDFLGARNMPAFGIPSEVTPRFVITIAWLWQQTANEELRRKTAAMTPPSIPPRSPSNARTGSK